MRVTVDLNDAYYAELTVEKSGDVVNVALVCAELMVARLVDAQEAVVLLAEWLDKADWKAVGHPGAPR